MDKNWQDIKTLAGQYAADNFQNGLNCAEAVLDACIRSGALDLPEEAVGFMSGFGGGIGVSGFTCGALTAAVFANCAEYGRKNPMETPLDIRKAEMKEWKYKRYNHLVAQFVRFSGSGLCREIIGQFPDGYTDPDTRPNCTNVVREAAGIAVDFLQMEEEEIRKLDYDWSVIGIPGWTH